MSGWRATSVTKTAAYTITVLDEIILADAAGGAFTLTLPTAAAMSGHGVYVVRMNLGVNAVTIDADGAELINGTTTAVLTLQYQSILLWSDGTQWVSIGRGLA